MQRNNKSDEKRRGKDQVKNHRRQDGTLNTNLGHPDGVPGFGADLASTDMEVLAPSPAGK